MALVLLACSAVRLATIGAPALDRTYWKEIDYLEISKNYHDHGFHFFQPELWWPADEPRATAMEFPLAPYLAALLYGVLGYNEFSARLVTLVAFLIVSLYTYKLARRELGPIVGVGAGLAAAIMPLYHDFGRMLFSEPVMIAAAVMALYHYAQWVDGRKFGDWLIAMTSFSLAVALKLTPLYLLLPLGWIVLRGYGGDWRRYRDLALLIACALVLPAIWYANAYRLSSTALDVFGIYKGKYGGHDKLQTLAMLADPTWYSTIEDRLLWHVLGGRIGAAFLAIGIATAIVARRGGLFFAYFLALAAFFAIVAEGHVDAPYRQLESIPVLATFVALGALAVAAAVTRVPQALVNRTTRVWAANSDANWRLSRYACLSLVSLAMLAIGARKADAIFARPTNRPVDEGRWRLAQVIREHADKATRIVVAGEYSIHKGGNDYSPVLYHYAGVQGWTLEPGEWNLPAIEEFRRKGATLFAAVNMSREPEAAPFLEELRNRYPLLYEHDDDLLLDLRQPTP